MAQPPTEQVEPDFPGSQIEPGTVVGVAPDVSPDRRGARFHLAIKAARQFPVPRLDVGKHLAKRVWNATSGTAASLFREQSGNPGLLQCHLIVAVPRYETDLVSLCEAYNFRLIQQNRFVGLDG